MFDLSDQTGSVRRKSRNPLPVYADPKPMTPRQLDSNRMVDMHKRLLDYYMREVDRQRQNRIEQAQDEDFYDNIQWSEEDAEVLRERGQLPLVYNVVSASVDWVLGTERRTRTDFNVLPRRKEDGEQAQRKTQLLKYLADVNDSEFNVSRAFGDSVKVGVGWLEDSLATDGEGEPLSNRYESWRNMLWDSSALDFDLQDGRYMFRSKWIDLDVMQAIFPKRAGLLDRSADAANDFLSLDLYGDEVMDQQEIALENTGPSRTSDQVTGFQRRRVRAIEGWIRVPVPTQRMRGGVFDREIYDPWSPGHVDAINAGEAELIETNTMRMHVAIFTPAGMLYFGPSPYRHNRFPFTPIWGKKRGRDGLPYGLVRNLKDIQTDVNKRASKALAILSSNKVVMDEGAVEDIDEFRDEVSRPDAIIVKKPNKELKLEVDRDLAQWHVELMSRSISMIQQASGVTDENLGRRTNASSGIAIQRRQDQGSLATAIYFDHLLYARKKRGEKVLANVEQFMSEQKAFRITNMRGRPEYITINDGLPENDIVRTKADYIIDEDDWNATLRQAAVDQLLETMTRFPPEAALVLLDLVVENMDLPNRDELVRRIRSLTGQRDPDAEEDTPEEQARAAAQAEQQAAQKAMFDAQLRKALADALKSEAQADEIIEKIVNSRVAAQNAALDAGGKALALPAAAHVADHILAESGYRGASNQPQGLGLPDTMAPQAPGLGLPPPAPTTEQPIAA